MDIWKQLDAENTDALVAQATERSKADDAATNLTGSAPVINGPQPDRNWKTNTQDVLATGAKGITNLGDALIGIADIPTMGQAGRSASLVGLNDVYGDPLQAEQALLGHEQDIADKKSNPYIEESPYSAPQQWAQQQVTNAKGFGGKFAAAVRNPSTIATTVGESLPTRLAGGLVGEGLVAATGLSPVIGGALGEGIMGAGSAAESIRKDSASGTITPSQAGMAVGSGIGTTAFGVLGGKFAQKLGLTDVDTLFANNFKKIATNAGIEQGEQGFASSVAQVAGRMAAGGFTEAVFEELPQTIQETMWQNAATGKPLTEGLDEAAAMAILSGGAMGSAANIGATSHGQSQTPEQKAEAKAALDRNLAAAELRKANLPTRDLIALKEGKDVEGYTPEMLASKGLGVEHIDAIINEREASLNSVQQRLNDVEAAGKGGPLTKVSQLVVADDTNLLEAEQIRRYTQAQNDIARKNTALEAADAAFQTYNPEAPAAQAAPVLPPVQTGPVTKILDPETEADWANQERKSLAERRAAIITGDITTVANSEDYKQWATAASAALQNAGLRQEEVAPFVTPEAYQRQVRETPAENAPAPAQEPGLPKYNELNNFDDRASIVGISDPNLVNKTPEQQLDEAKRAAAAPKLDAQAAEAAAGYTEWQTQTRAALEHNQTANATGKLSERRAAAKEKEAQEAAQAAVVKEAARREAIAAVNKKNPKYAQADAAAVEYDETFQAYGTVPETGGNIDEVEAQKFEREVRIERARARAITRDKQWAKEEAEQDAVINDKAIPKEVRASAKAEAMATIKSDPIYAHVDEIKKRGKLNSEQLAQDYDSDTLSQLGKRYPGLLSKVGTQQPDTVAGELGYQNLDHMVQTLLAAKTQKSLEAELTQQHRDAWENAEEASKQEAAKPDTSFNPDELQEDKITFVKDEQIGGIVDQIENDPRSFNAQSFDGPEYNDKQREHLKAAYRNSWVKPEQKPGENPKVYRRRVLADKAEYLGEEVNDKLFKEKDNGQSTTEKSTSESTTEGISATEGNTTQEVLTKEQRGKIRKALSSLSPIQRQAAEALIRSGKIKVLTQAEAEAMTGVNEDGTQGFVDNKITYLIPENIAPDNLWGLIRHEIGTHVGKLIRDKGDFKALLKSIHARQQERGETGDAIRAAYYRVNQDENNDNKTDDERAEEALAYLVEDAPETGLVKRFIQKVKDALRAIGINPGNFSVEDLTALADAAIHQEAGFGSVQKDFMAKNTREKGSILSPPGPGVQRSTHNTKERATSVKNYLKKNDVAPDKIEKLLVSEKEFQILKDLLEKNADRLPRQAMVDGGPIRSNNDNLYLWSFDLASMCVKRLGYGANLSEFAKRLGRAPNIDESIMLTIQMVEDGHDAPCLYCYVESPRRIFLQEVNRYAAAMAGQTEFLNEKAPGYQADLAMAKKAQAAGFALEDFDYRYLIDPEYAQRNVSEHQKKFAEIYQHINNRSASASTQNKVKTYQEYKAQMLTKANSSSDKTHNLPLREYLNARAGFRIFSTSDFQIEHAMDLMQLVQDLHITDMIAHAYTKVEDFVRTFGKTGLKIQCSVFGVEQTNADGTFEIKQDTTMGMEWEAAKKFRKIEGGNVGTVFVTTSENMTHWALQQPWIDYIIPFHASGMPKEYYTEDLSWTNFTGTQLEKMQKPRFSAKTGKNTDYGVGDLKILMADILNVGDGSNRKGMTDKEATNRYLALLKERGTVGVFPQFQFIHQQVMKDGKMTWEPTKKVNPNYIKLKKDYSRTDTDFTVPDPTKIDANRLFRLTKEWLKRGGDKPVEAETATIDKVMKRIANGETGSSMLQGSSLRNVQRSVRAKLDALKKDHNVISSLTHERENGDLVLSSFIVDKANRKQGIGSSYMKDLIKIADENGRRVLLSPGVKGDLSGSTSRGRLVTFYKRFGFVENKGRNKDYSISEGMIRYPKDVQRSKAWGTPQQRVSSASTSISYPNPETKAPVIFSAFRKGQIQLGPLNADIGGGRYDQITDWLKTKDVENVVWDRFNREEAHNAAAEAKLKGGQADTATISNVLNVIPEAESRTSVIATAHDSLKPGGKAFFSMYEAPKAGEVAKKDAYQVGQKTSAYIPEIEKVFGKGSVVKKGPVLIATKKGGPAGGGKYKPVDTNSTNFKKWFGASKLVDEKGAPVRVYHGSPETFEAFDKTKLGKNRLSPGAGLGHFFAMDRTESQAYGDVQSFFVKLENPRTMNSYELPTFRSVEEAQAWTKRQQLAGYDGLILQDEEHVVVFENNQVKSAELNTGEFNPNDARFNRSKYKPVDTTSENFKRWFKDSKAVDQDGDPVRVYHGTTFGFFAFDREKARKENDLGSAFYFSDERGDSDQNYAGMGPDLTNRYEAKVERLQQEISEDPEAFGLRDNATDAAIEKKAHSLAKKELVGKKPQVMELYLSLQNPVVLGGDNPTYLGYDLEIDEDELNNFKAQAWDEIKADEDLTDEDREDYEDQIEDRAREMFDENNYDQEPSGPIADILKSIEKQIWRLDEGNFDQVREDVQQAVYFGDIIRADKLIKILKESEGLAYATDYDNDSGLMSAEVIRQAFEDAGFDGFIDHTVSRFNMDGVGQTHYLAFQPEQVKSAVSNTGEFDPTNPDIRRSKAFFSKLQQVTDTKFTDMKAQSVENFLLKQGVKKGEMDDLRPWLAAKKPTDKVTKAELSDFVKATTVDYEDVILSESQDETVEEVSNAKQIIADGGKIYAIDSEGRAIKIVTDSGVIAPYIIDNWENYTVKIGDISNAKSEGKTHFGTYTTPGAKEGSYREMFVTAPGLKAPPADKSAYLALKKQRDALGFDGYGTKEYADLDAKMSLMAERLNDTTKWKDGHGQYEHIANPIVRIRFNEVAGPNSERILRVEEMQGPSEFNQTKMPGYMKDNIYQVGVKRILAYAKEKGFDGVALATEPGRTAGETQADRYSLEKQISRIVHAESEGGGYDVSVEDKDGGVVYEKYGQTPKDLESLVGKEIANKIVAGEGKDVDGSVGFEEDAETYATPKELSGLDLKVGGEGLKQLYDVDLPNIFKAWGKEKMGAILTTIPISGDALIDYFNGEGAGEDVQTSLPYIPITDKTPSSFPMRSKRTYDAATIQAKKNVGAIVEPVTMKDWWTETRKDLKLKIQHYLVDQYAPLKKLGQDAYIQARMAAGQGGALEAMMHFGDLILRDGVTDVVVGKTKGIIESLQALQGEQHDFLWWIAAHRAEKLTAEERENLFQEADIEALLKLNQGKMPDGKDRATVYKEVLKDYVRANKNVMDIAEQSELIDSETRAQWEHDMYVPFYRAAVDGVDNPRSGSGLVRQYAFKQLKGGTRKLHNDLLANVLMNWSHVLDASAKNRAASKSLQAAEDMGIAEYLGESPKGKGSVYYMGRFDKEIKAGTKYFENGIEKTATTDTTVSMWGKKYYSVSDPLILESLNALEFSGFKGMAMDALTKTKRLLTMGVTANPAFKIRNLIRDSMTTPALSGASYNPLKNAGQGFRAMREKGQTYASLLAGGGIIRFGSMLEDNSAAHVDKLINAGVKRGDILDTKEKITGFFSTVWDKYNEVGDISEGANRAALYEQLRAQGKTHAEASYQARDLMDFHLRGAGPAARFLAQTVPFFNARAQGLYKLARAGHADPKRMGAVLGATAMASIALMLAYKDDDDWKEREDWDRDTYFWFKAGGRTLRIPKGFEIGAIATLAERGLEYFISDEMTGKRLGDRVLAMLGQTLSFNPTPQIIKPLVDLYADKDSFTGRPIEGPTLEGRLKSDRMTNRTSEFAKLIGAAGDTTGISPVQVDHLIRGYFGWLGTAATVITDIASRPVLDRPEAADMRLRDMFLAGNFVETLPRGSSRYVTEFYDQAKELQQSWNSVRDSIKRGDKAPEDAGVIHSKAQQASRAQKLMGVMTNRIRAVENDKIMSGAEKRTQIDLLTERRNQLAKKALQ